jgi:MoaA/NifB/PqqE/SkfB family radical SAM enzyme
MTVDPSRPIAKKASSNERLETLRLLYMLANETTETADGFRDPDDIVSDGLTEVPDPDEGAQDGFVLAMAAAKALREGDNLRAETLAQRGLALLQNNLHLQSLLARAKGEPDLRRQGTFCRAPFENLETEPNGDVYFCCPAWLPKPIGNIHKDGHEAIWNSQAARDIRASIHDQSYRHCSRLHCPKLSGNGLDPIEKVQRSALGRIVAARRTRLDHGPKKIVLSHDRSCNLACPSCRSSMIVAHKAEQAEMNALADRTIFPMLATADRVRITASGDPFGSAHFQYVLRNLDQSRNPRLKVDLQTNGLLLTPALWERLKLAGRVGQLLVSVDAARAETYRVVRRPGSFEVLEQNLIFFGELRKANLVERFRLDFVVQARNYKEMPQFVEMARKLGCDGVKFQMIRSWGAMSPAEFAAQYIGDRSHPEYSSFIDILRAIAQERPFAEFWGMGQALRDAGLGVDA